MEKTWDTSILAEYFEYDNYAEMTPKEGWLLNYHTRDKICPENSKVSTYGILYFVDSENKNFRVEVLFSPKILVEVAESLFTSTEEFLLEKYAESIKSVSSVKRVDLQKNNHLANDGSEYLSIHMYSEQDALYIRREIEEIVRKNKIRRKEKAATMLFVKEKKQCRETNPEEAILDIYEYDIPTAVQMSIELNINAGRWYKIEYNGEHTIQEIEKVIPPDLRIFSFDIETTKDPLKFPSADKDKIMMISIMSTIEGWLIVNREIVSEDIKRFEFRPTEDIGGEIDIFNEKNEENLLNRFMQLLHMYKPHVITTYNGDFFDWPFVETRLKQYGIDLYTSLGFKNNGKDEYVCDYILHLDCYRWVKRDSYLPAGSQGLKSVTKAKLGYFPDELDPENMVKFAETKPKVLASYSVSDAVATHFLYLKYVHPFIFSLASLIPLCPDDVLRKGSGTLCETLLVKEARECNVLIPAKKKSPLLFNYNGKIAESLSYVGGHVECLKSGIYRSDFEYEFTFNSSYLEKMTEEVEKIVENELNGKKCENKEEVVSDIVQKLRDLGKRKKAQMKPNIYHLDVGAMYPNIILTNRLQPSAVTDEKRCGQCIYSESRSICQRHLNWKARAEVYPIDEKTVGIISKKTADEFYTKKSKREQIDKKERFLTYEHYLRENLIEHAKKISRKTREVVIENKQSIICQRENPFYVNAVRKFRDRRNIYKKLAKESKAKAKKLETEESLVDGESSAEWKKKAGIYDSLQIAHKCVLNSFYGYVMKKGARWHSMEMAAVVCQTGSSIIQSTKKVIDAFGITLELDTDGIWALLPESFPLNYTLKAGSETISFSYICSLLNYMLLELFSNHQYQIKEASGEYVVKTENSIQFEIDGPYRAMFLPGSTKEGESIKKRYIVINSQEKISELKGFEFKRRGELRFIKAFQEEMFNTMLSGHTLQECYMALAECADYWIDIIETKAEALAQDEIFNCFGETRNMAKNAEEYSVVKSTCRTAAERLSELLGQNVVVKGMSCSYIIAKYPENEPVTSRAVPQSVFYASPEIKNKYLKKWLCLKTVPENIHEIVDWSYYMERLSSIIARIIIVPAALQGLPNPVKRVQAPAWAISRRKIVEFLKKTTAEEKENIEHRSTLVKEKENEKVKLKLKKVGHQKLLEYLSVRKNKSEKPAETKIEVNEKKLTAIENAAVYISKVTENSFTAVYLDQDVFIEREVHIKKIFYIQADASMLNTILKTYETAQTSIRVEKVRKMVVGGSGEKDLIRIEVDPLDFRSKFHNYTKLFESPEVKSIHELDIPQEIRALEATRFKKVPMYAIASCLFEGKALYGVYDCSELSLENIPDRFETSTEGVFCFEKLEDLLENLNKKAPGALFCSKSPQIASLITKHLHISLEIPSPKTIQGRSVAMSLLLETLCKTARAAQKIIDVAEYSNTPILCVRPEESSFVLDYLHYKERVSRNIIGWNNAQARSRVHYTLATDDENPFNREFYKEGVYEGISVGFSLSGTVLLSIIEADTLMKEERCNIRPNTEIQALQALMKNIVYGCIKKQKGAFELATRVPCWIRSQDKNTTVTEFISARVSILQIKFISGIVSTINRAGSDVILADCEDLVVHTSQSTKGLAQVQIDHIFSEINNLAYGSLLRIRVTHWYSRIVMIDQANYHKVFLSGNVQYKFMYPVPTAVIDSLLSYDDLPALELIKETYLRSTQDGFSLARLLIKIYGLKHKSPYFSRKASAVVQLSPFSEILLREFGEFTTLTVECTCSATTSIHASVQLFKNTVEMEQFFNNLAQNSQKISHKCKKCSIGFTRALLETRAMHEIYTIAKKAIKTERKCTGCKKPSASVLSKRCSCGGRFTRNINEEFKEATNSILSLCTLVPTMPVIIYAREMAKQLSLDAE